MVPAVAARLTAICASGDQRTCPADTKGFDRCRAAAVDDTGEFLANKEKT